MEEEEENVKNLNERPIDDRPHIYFRICFTKKKY